MGNWSVNRLVMEMKRTELTHNVNYIKDIG